MRNVLRVGAMLGLALSSALPVAAQSVAPPDPPALLLIYREEVKPGKGAAHGANEQAWAAAFAKGQAPMQWLGMTAVAGPSEAWFLSRYDSYAAIQKNQDAMQASAALTAEEDKFSAQDGELLNRTSTIIARYRPALSYQPKVAIPQMRYMQVDVVQVRPGHGGDFTEAWASIVAAHEKAKMNEHWAVYAVESGMPTGTFLFMYPHKSLDALDAAQGMHGAAEYRDAVGESGRAKQNRMMRDSVAMQETLIFAFRPRMSLLSTEFTDQDPAFWIQKQPVAIAKKTGDKH
jgi:hypothetical protein